MTIVSDVCDGLVLNNDLSEDQLAGSLMTMNGMKLLSYAQENQGIKLTKSEAFYRKCVEWAAQEFNWPRHTVSDLYVVNKVLNEQDFLPLWVMHDLFFAGNLMRRYKGKAVLTKKGKVILGDHGALQALIFEMFFTRFDFGELERFPSFIDVEDYRHFFGVVDNRLSDWVELRSFAGWCLPIDAMPPSRFGPAYEASLALRLRVVRPLNWLGLIEVQRPGGRSMPLEKVMIRKTPLFNQFLRFVDLRQVDSRMH